MRIGEIAKRAAVRRIVYVVIALALAYAGIGEAKASCWGGNGAEWSKNHNYTCSTQGEAAAKAQGFCGVYPDGCEVKPPEYNTGGYAGKFSVGKVYDWGVVVYFQQVCENGWNAGAMECNMSDAECLAINAEAGFIGVGEITESFTSQCMANGCIYEAVGSVGSVSVDGVSSGLYVADYEWTRACDSAPPPEAAEPETLADPPPQKCFAGTNPQVCIKNDGEHCFSASTGKQICWRPGETGTKTSGDTAQKRVPGTSPATAPTPPEGESFTTGGSATTNTTLGGTTVTTTTTNFTTTGGTEAGPDQGEADDGSGTTSAGGGDCSAPPVVSGDAALAMIATQAWHTRCAVEAGNAANVTGDVSDCSQPFTVEGDNANAEQLRALRAEICTEIPLEQQSDGTTGGDAADTAVWDSLSVETLLGGLDDSGFVGGSDTCPALPVFDLGSFGVFTPEVPYWCQLLEWLAAFVMFGAAIVSIMILME